MWMPKYNQEMLQHALLCTHVELSGFVMPNSINQVFDKIFSGHKFVFGCKGVPRRAVWVVHDCLIQKCIPRSDTSWRVLWHPTYNSTELKRFAWNGFCQWKQNSACPYTSLMSPAVMAITCACTRFGIAKIHCQNLAKTLKVWPCIWTETVWYRKRKAVLPKHRFLQPWNKTIHISYIDIKAHNTHKASTMSCNTVLSPYNVTPRSHVIGNLDFQTLFAVYTLWVIGLMRFWASKLPVLPFWTRQCLLKYPVRT